MLDPALLSQLRNETLLATVTDPEKGANKVPLTLSGDWKWYDWRPAGQGGWRDVYVSHHRRWHSEYLGCQTVARDHAGQ